MKSVGCLVVRMEDRKFVEEWQYADFLGMLQQLGVLPPLTRPPTSLASNLAGSKEFDKHRKNAAPCGSG